MTDTFTFHDLLNQAGIKHVPTRFKLGIIMADAYKSVTGEAAKKVKVKGFSVNVYPNDFRVIAENIINQNK